MTRVHAADGSLIAEYAKERRLYLPVQDVPKLVIDAFLSAEDKNFYHALRHRSRGHHARHLRRISPVRGVASRARRLSRSRSRRISFSSEQTYDRKFKEMLLALRIEATYTKEKILELYLNQIYLGFRQLWHRCRRAELLRQIRARADARGSGLSRGPAEGAEQLQSFREARRGDRPA